MDLIESKRAWWKGLNPGWQQVFREVVLQREPSDADLGFLINMQVLRLAGPGAPFPNCNFKLQDLSGISALQQLETLIISHHDLKTITELAGLQKLKAVFLNNNKIISLKGIEGLFSLEQLYIQGNKLTSIREIENLHNLQELYVNDNNISTLEGLTEAHADHLKRLVCLPNENLKHKHIIKTEIELGILCR